MTRQSVLWLIKGLNRGGAERLVSQMAPRLDRDRFDVEVAYVSDGADDFLPDILAGGVPVTCLGGRRNVELSWPLNLRRLLRRRRFDIVHAHSPLPAAVARLVAPRGTRHLYTEHNMWGVYRGPTFAVNALTYARNERVFAVSDGVATSIERPRWTRLGRMPDVEVLLHGVDAATAPRGPAARAAARELLGIAPDRPVVGNVANFSPKKDQATLLQAFAKISSELPDALLLLVGQGPLEDQLRAQVTELGLEEDVWFLGSRDDVPALLPALDVFVLSSTFEGLPISLLEAMAAEVACVCTAVGGIPEAVRDGTDGLLVDTGEPAELASRVVELLADPASRGDLALHGRQRLVAAFESSRALDRLVVAYEATDAAAGGAPA